MLNFIQLCQTKFSYLKCEQPSRKWIYLAGRFLKLSPHQEKVFILKNKCTKKIFNGFFFATNNATLTNFKNKTDWWYHPNCCPNWLWMRILVHWGYVLLI